MESVEQHMAKIRSLELIIVTVDGVSFTVSLILDDRMDNEEKVSELEEDFLRKLAKATPKQYFGVAGDPRIDDESAKKLFRIAILKPYLEDGYWPHPIVQGKGLLALQDPGVGVNNTLATSVVSGRGSTTVGKRRKSTEVRLSVLMAVVAGVRLDARREHSPGWCARGTYATHTP